MPEYIAQSYLDFSDLAVIIFITVYLCAALIIYVSAKCMFTVYKIHKQYHKPKRKRHA